MEDFPSGPALSEDEFLLFQVDSFFEKLTECMRNMKPYFEQLGEHLVASRMSLWLDICFV